MMPFASNRVRKQYDHAYFLLNTTQPNCNLVCLVCPDKTFQALHSCSMGTSRRTSWRKKALMRAKQHCSPEQVRQLWVCASTNTCII